MRIWFLKERYPLVEFRFLYESYYVVSVWRGFLFLWVLGMGYVTLLWHSLSLPLNIFQCVVSGLLFRDFPTEYTENKHSDF